MVRLLDADPDWLVSLEVFEDIGLEDPQGNRIAEQTKSTGNGNPVGDHAVGLWKTLNNWIDAVESGELDLERTLFEIYVSTPKAGRIVESFSRARTLDEAGTALEEAKHITWGDAPDYPLKRGIPKSIAEYLSRVFDADVSLVSKLIMSFTYRSGTGSPQQELRSLLSKALIPTEFLDDVLKYSLGWVKHETDILLEQKKPDGDIKRYLVITYWLKKYRNIEEVTMDHAYTCYRHMGTGWQVPGDAAAPFRAMKGKHYGWMKAGSAKGAYVINHLGENEVGRMGN